METGPNPAEVGLGCVWGVGGGGIQAAMKMLNACVVLVSSCSALLGMLGTAAGPLPSSAEHPFDEMYDCTHQHAGRSPELNRAA